MKIRKGYGLQIQVAAERMYGLQITFQEIYT